jgi:hypothetical protein
MMGTFPFIVGNQRSGTTLLRAMFDSHPDMAIPPESYWVVGLSRQFADDGERFDQQRFARTLLEHDRFRFFRIPEEDLRGALQLGKPKSYSDGVRIVYELYARMHGKKRYGDKTPRYVVDLPLLAGLFPEARFIHIIRDGRDAALSLMDVPFGPNGIQEAARLWRRRVRAGREGGKQLGAGRYREIRYEELIDRPEDVLRSMCPFAGLDFDPSMLLYHERADRILSSEERRDQHTRLNRPPTKGLRDWHTQMSAQDLAVFEAIAGDLLEELGYERGVSRIPLRVSLRTGSSELAIDIRSSLRATARRVLAGRR